MLDQGLHGNKDQTWEQQLANLQRSVKAIFVNSPPSL